MGCKALGRMKVIRDLKKKKLAQSLAALFNLCYMKYVFNYVITYIGTDDLDCSFVLPLKTNNSNEIQHARDDDEPLTPTSNKKKARLTSFLSQSDSDKPAVNLLHMNWTISFFTESSFSDQRPTDLTLCSYTCFQGLLS